MIEQIKREITHYADKLPSDFVGRLRYLIGEVEGKDEAGINLAKELRELKDANWELRKALEPFTKNVVYRALRHYDKQSLYKEDEWIDLDTAKGAVSIARQALEKVKT